MKIIRFLNDQGEIQFAARQEDGSALVITGDIFSDFAVTDCPARITQLLTPLVPTAILGIGLNYRRHAEEINASIPEYPIVFAKSLNAVQNPDAPILIPTFLSSDQVDYECELAVVIGKPCKNVDRAHALKYVLGYTCGNDISARDWQIQKGGSQWHRGKSFDTFAPLGPCLVTPEDIPDPNTLPIMTILNGQVVQDWNTSDMIFDVPALIEFLSGSTTLLPGTVILTGTPQGVGMVQTPPLWLKPGDVVSIEIGGIGTLTNPVALEV